jgi:uncharacterized protein YjbI with pentapeptide repeats
MRPASGVKALANDDDLKLVRLFAARRDRLYEKLSGGLDLRGARLFQVDLMNADLSSADFAGANLSHV